MRTASNLTTLAGVKSPYILLVNSSVVWFFLLIN